MSMPSQLARHVATLSLAIATIALPPSMASAQQPSPPQFGNQLPPSTAAPAAKPAKPPAAAKPAKANPDGTSAPASGSESALKQRVEALEDQLVDMQVLVGTLETLAKSGGASSASQAYRAGNSGSSGADTARVEGLEGQVRTLTSQVQQLSEQVRSLGGQPRRSDVGPTGGSTVGSPRPTAAQPVDLAGANTGPGSNAGFPSSTLDNGPAPAPTAAPTLSADGGNPKQLYETAYGYLLQQDYGAAETSFDEFLKRYPNDALAGNAQFWLGESYFVRGQYKAAASAFLKGYQSYGRSAKAPDSLLKLAMSLGRLGQKDQACSSFAELNTRYPTASADVKSRAAAERQRSGCA
jgi:tol-pal system protein YbgF